MKKGLFLAILGAAISLLAVGCSSYRGGTGQNYGTAYGTAAELHSPGGLDMAAGKGEFRTLPPMDTNILTMPESDFNDYGQ